MPAKKTKETMEIPKTTKSKKIQKVIRSTDIVQDETLTKEAKRHVWRLKGFYSHLASFLLVIVFLTILNAIVSPGTWWVKWVFLGWGLGVLMHALDTFRFLPYNSKHWEQKKIQEYIQKYKKR